MKKEYVIGLVGIIALVALFLGINFLKGKALFNTNSEYYVSFSNARGLAKSSVVYVDGFEVGIVSDILYDYKNPGNVLVEISVDPKLVFCHGTHVSLDAGLMGGCTLNVTPVPLTDQVYHPGDTIPGDDTSGLMGKAENIMPRVYEIVDKLDTLLASLNTILTNPHLPKIIGNVEQVTRDLTETTKHMNVIFSEELPTLAETYNKVGENVLHITENFKSFDLQPTLDNVNATISNVNEVVSQMRNPDGTFGALMYDRSLYNSLNKTVASVDSLMTDIKTRPKRYVHFSIFGRKDK